MVGNGINPFVEYQPSILMAAAEIYRAQREGVEPDPDVSRVMIMPSNLGEVSLHGMISDESLRRAQVAEAQVNVAARAVARMALFADDIDAGGIKSVPVRFEAGLTRLFERKYIKDALASGLVDTIRGKKPSNSR